MLKKSEFLSAILILIGLFTTLRRTHRNIQREPEISFSLWFQLQKNYSSRIIRHFENIIILWMSLWCFLISNKDGDGLSQVKKPPLSKFLVLNKKQSTPHQHIYEFTYEHVSITYWWFKSDYWLTREMISEMLRIWRTVYRNLNTRLSLEP